MKHMTVCCDSVFVRDTLYIKESQNNYVPPDLLKIKKIKHNIFEFIYPA